MEWMDEYAVLCRQWARAQRHTEACQRQWQADKRGLESELVRLRGALLALRTAWLWGIKPQPRLWPRPSPSSLTSPVADTDPLIETDFAQETLCRVGCQGHGHPWLDEQGQCRLQGRACTSAITAPSVTTADP
jgi:hypothetical protein